MMYGEEPHFKDDEKEFAGLRDVIKKQIGFNCDEYKKAHLKRRLAVRLRANRSTSYKDYADCLVNNADEMQKLKDCLTINVTELFRNPETYNAVSRSVLPELFKNKTKNNTIKVWSAGSSDGKEAYSIAIMMREFMDNSGRRYNISIIGTDIDENILRTAETGTYKTEQLKKISKERLEKFFVKIDENRYQVVDDIRRKVTFKNHDLISGRKLSGFDIIFCRNVTIYFEQKLQERLYLDFYNALNDRGYFVMGKTETLNGSASKLFIPVNPGERIYMKKVNGFQVIQGNITGRVL
ncbi:MAG: protein-glutamate O-methyltransferase CheR [Candidatus Methanoperedens sp.]|nr:protein-glutamate O-methyltransferase CheR [Candidatus Methanoperedens sp.]